MSHFSTILIKRLEDRGIELNIIPGFIRSFANLFFLNPQMNLVQINTRLKYLGWKGFDLDYHTFQLAVACYEIDGLKSLYNHSETAV